MVLSKPGVNFGERSLITGERVSRSIVAAIANNNNTSENKNQTSSVLLAGLTKENFELLPKSVIKMLDHKLALLMIKSHRCFQHDPSK